MNEAVPCSSLHVTFATWLSILFLAIIRPFYGELEGCVNLPT
jgi:hypothetical protein